MEHKNLASAWIACMEECGPIAKSLEVGFGQNKYKGVSDADVLNRVRPVFIKHGIALFVEKIDKDDTIMQQDDGKLHIVCSITTTLRAVHVASGESQLLQAIGHGIDKGQYADKAAGKAMTYAKKNALLQSLLITTGTDSEDTHSASVAITEEELQSQKLEYAAEVAASVFAKKVAATLDRTDEGDITMAGVGQLLSAYKNATSFSNIGKLAVYLLLKQEQRPMLDAIWKIIEDQSKGFFTKAEFDKWKK